MERFNRRLAAVEEHYHKEKRIHIEYVDLLTGLMQAMGEQNPEAICALDLSEEELIRRLEGHVFDAPAILGEIDAPDLNLPGGVGRIFSAMRKRAAGLGHGHDNGPGHAGRHGHADEAHGSGKLWEILSHPSDPFPSDPCAHNETEDLALDLATGSLYHDRQYVHKLFRKDLTAIRGRIAEKYLGLVLPDLRE